MSAVYEVINPANEQAVKKVDLADLAATDAVIEKASKHFKLGKRLHPLIAQNYCAHSPKLLVITGRS
jgi:acyl-CoA reductase-like NAD-dependent aldehyde dehydrogenase